jgi:hypothetical protein
MAATLSLTTRTIISEVEKVAASVQAVSCWAGRTADPYFTSTAQHVYAQRWAMTQRVESAISKARTEHNRRALVAALATLR